MKCRLCLEDKELQKSHIIPEFFYKPVYDGLHRLNVVSTEPGDKIKYQQKGYREKLLCRDCEQRLGRFEDYGRRVIYGGRGSRGTGVKIQDVGNGFKLRNIDYHKFKLFQLSLLWRASIASLDFFTGVNLGPHEETIRKMLVSQTPGEPHQFGCIMTILLWEENKPLDGIILEPEQLYIEGHKCFRLVSVGCLWFFIVSSHSKDFMLRDFFLSQGGELIIPFVRRDQYADLVKRFAEVLKRNRTMADI